MAATSLRRLYSVATPPCDSGGNAFGPIDCQCVAGATARQAEAQGSVITMRMPACGCNSGAIPPVLPVLTMLLVTLGACSGGSPHRMHAALDGDSGVSASPRVAWGGHIPKGGGRYKIGAPYRISGRWYVPQEDPYYDRVGVASWYGEDFHGRKTANGEIYDMGALTAAHPTLPLPSYAHVTNLETGRTILVRINDRGPYAKERIIDLSRHAARLLGYEGQGLARVRVRYAGRAPLDGSDYREQAFLASQPWYRPDRERRYAERSGSPLRR